MNILIVGNGFDLAHGLPTRYGDFLRYIREFYSFCEDPETFSNRNADMGAYFMDMRKNRKEAYYELAQLTKNNSWLKLFLSIFESREEAGKDGWIDFESEISYVIQTLDDARRRCIQRISDSPTPLKHLEELVGLHSDTTSQILRIVDCVDKEEHPESHITINPHAVALDSIDKVKKRLYSDLNRMTRCLELYLADYVATRHCEPIPEIEKLIIHKLLSFNYTNTYCKVYGKTEMEETDNVDFVHGRADIHGNVKTCNLVLGIDEYQNKESRDNDNEFVQFKKFFQRIFKGTGSHYIDWLNLYLQYRQHDHLNVYIYGHSLDVTDRDILNKIITTEGAVTTVFYHSQEALGNYIANLVKIIGEQKLIEMTDGYDRKIVFEKQSCYHD